MKEELLKVGVQEEMIFINVRFVEEVILIDFIDSKIVY
jgi:hypothetical protein